MNALVLYVGTQAIAYIHSKSGTPSMSTITHSSHMDIFQNLAVDLDTEGTLNFWKTAWQFFYSNIVCFLLNCLVIFCANYFPICHCIHFCYFLSFFLFPGRYLFLNAVANQLRYPNSHTHYFSCVLLYLFAEANTEAIQEQITRYSGSDITKLLAFLSFFFYSRLH